MDSLRGGQNILREKIQEIKEFNRIFQNSLKSMMGNLVMQASRLSLTSVSGGGCAPAMSDSMSTSSSIMSPQTKAKLDQIKYYFASRTSAYDDIWNICYRLSEEIHEQVLDVFILTLIDHWDKELERYVLLCERCLILMDFDFQSLETRQLFIYDYARFNSIKIGPLVYPQMAFSYGHQSKYGMRFQWDSQKPLNYRQYWNPWSKEIPWITLTQHPLAIYIDDLLNDLEPDPEDAQNGQQQSNNYIDDQYFTKEYLQQIRRRFSLETFHDKLLEIMNSFQIPPIKIPFRLQQQTEESSSSVPDESLLMDKKRNFPMLLDEAVRQNLMLEFQHRNVREEVTIVNYTPILCENYFNLPAMLFNRSSFGYYRLRLF